jgi:hypothetical protein
MTESIAQRINATADVKDQKEIRKLLESILTDLTSVATQFNQLRTDYNANATIATDTTATAITLNTTA